ncbi:LytR/AlgR family response regulator transcription factor [Marinicella sp. W31]|uniref:LytR/AlgR family response regulator transcription factor n=1 Tax=Marinicella sp. W31 TaxID=3023713 RepID=UPI003757E826
MSKIKTLVVEDEYLAQQLLVRWLSEIQEIELLGCESDVTGAVTAIEKIQPDLIFLDINLSGDNAFQIIHQTPKHLRPDIVFVTAYTEYAVKAFRVNAVDYLKKPFDRSHLLEAVERVIERRSRKQPDSKQEVHEHITIKDGTNMTFVGMDEILWVESAGDYLVIHTAEQHYVHRSSMKKFLQSLSQSFARIHRSTIVNLERIKHIQPRGHGDADVVMCNNTELRLSRRYREAIKAFKVS